MPEENALGETLRETDIYRQYAVTLLSVNAFYYDRVGEKFSMNDAQQQMSILGGIADNYLLKRVGDGTDDISNKARIEVKNLIAREEAFITTKIDKTTDFEKFKQESMEIIKEYDRLLLMHGVCK